MLLHQVIALKLLKELLLDATIGIEEVSKSAMVQAEKANELNKMIKNFKI